MNNCRTRRARMLKKLLYFISINRKPNIAANIAFTVQIFAPSFGKQVKYRNAYEQLSKDYIDLMKNVVNDSLFSDNPLYNKLAL